MSLKSCNYEGRRIFVFELCLHSLNSTIGSMRHYIENQRLDP